ncbi:MAG: excinuclease ABC subunit A [Rhodospirillaceae bacterium]|uniref:UvrABC system protein A n=1 Tax=Candidatus Moanibacter tarae TaxID=2200854 RepID=A0A2Z4AC76_9BACT|nr:MAG: UvrABC system protein A [Candidatus Moanabacter tarae]MBH66942.1 excinuclease ABC subunit A [Rhodospirillaceae bacterium]|tara:strand:- start:7030 stop:9891 length:2862 start_codon:yes stop_codon:yes gene_type:complete
MSAEKGESKFIHIKGAREHNLANIELRIPRDSFIAITGVSGSGKSSLAFDTVYAEGYRKYIDSLSTKARQVLEQVKNPDVDFIHGLSPVIAIEQRTGTGVNPRSTVATATEISDYASLLWAIGGTVKCPLDGGVIERRSLDQCIDRIFKEAEGSRIMLLAPYLEAKAAVLREELPRLQQRGFQRVRIGGEIKNLDNKGLIEYSPLEIPVEIVIDRIVLRTDQRSRVADSLELAFREGNNQAVIVVESSGDLDQCEFVLSQDLACVECSRVYEPILPKSFSYNRPEGACITCGGMGETRQFSDSLLVPDPEKSVKKGAIKPFRFGSKRMVIRNNALLKQLAEQLPFDPEVPWKNLDNEIRNQILHGTGSRLFSFKLRGGNRKSEMVPFKGVVAELDEIRGKTSSEGLKARLLSYQVSSQCPTCNGERLNDLSRSVFLNGTSFPNFMKCTIANGLRLVRDFQNTVGVAEKLSEAVIGLDQRLRFLEEVGLGYLSLDRPYSTLSGGEAQRVRLATQLGMGLVGVVYVLDEPTIGLHPHDNAKLLINLRDLQERGNVVIVVEHDEETIRAADHLIELGPGAGRSGGQLVFQGTPKEAEKSKQSLTGKYLSGRSAVYKNADDLSPSDRWLRIYGARCHNLKGFDVKFPVGLVSCVTGVSGSGKSSLVNDILAKSAALRLNRSRVVPGAYGRIDGFDNFKRVIRIDQSAIGKSPRSNPATYVKLFDLLRNLFSLCPLSKIRGYKPKRFSFNVMGGRCERCRGDGMIRLDMQFLSDVYTECPSCLGNRYNRETLDVRFKGYNIADVLELTVSDSLELFSRQPRIMEKLKTLEEVGLGYLRLGQSSNTLSGGEAQRIKLALELSKRQQGDTLYLLDEPTSGLHWADVQKLMDLLFRLRDAGNTIIIIEHLQDVINVADWVVDLGPEGGEKGGQLLYSGTRSEFATTVESYTATYLRRFLRE